MQKNGIGACEALQLSGLITLTEQGIASRVLAKNASGNMTLFAFDRGQTISEHRVPFEAVVIVIEGQVVLTIEGTAVSVGAGDILRMPSGAPHSLEAIESSKMLLVMLKNVPMVQEAAV